MGYITNPKCKGSGIIACIPQKGICPVRCDDCFFQSGRSYLEPLSENLPNMAEPNDLRVYRINDGNDSNIERDYVIKASAPYKMKFYNTSIPKNIEKFDAPVVLTINSGKKTDKDVVLLKLIPKNLMFVRVRTNTWNLYLVEKAVNYYSAHEIPVILTFMAYFTTSIPEEYKNDYIFRKRTLNSYLAITSEAWERVFEPYRYNKWVYTCGMAEGEKGTTSCRHCGNCLREYFTTLERMEKC